MYSRIRESEIVITRGARTADFALCLEVLDYESQSVVYCRVGQNLVFVNVRRLKIVHVVSLEALHYFRELITGAPELFVDSLAITDKEYVGKRVRAGEI